MINIFLHNCILCLPITNKLAGELLAKLGTTSDEKTKKLGGGRGSLDAKRSSDSQLIRRLLCVVTLKNGRSL